MNNALAQNNKLTKDLEKAISENKFEVYRNNHFEVIISDENGKEYDDLRLCAESVDVNLYSTVIQLNVFVTAGVLDTIANLRPKQKLHIKYILISPDGNSKFLAYDGNVCLQGIKFHSDYNASTNAKITICLCNSVIKSCICS
jgi:hypothetical protein